MLTIEFEAGTTEAQAQTLLNNIGFAISNSDDPDTTTRTFTGLTVQDSGGVLNSGDDSSAASAVQTDITGVAVKDEPTSSGVTANDQTFTEGGTISTSNIFTGVTIDTIEAGQTILQADITLGGVQTGDSLTIDGQTVSSINADAATTALGGGSTHSYSISSGVLTIEFAAGTTEAQAQTVLNNIGFAIATIDDPDTTTRTFTGLTVQDSGGVLNSGDDTSAASAVQTDITVVAVNDTPTLAATPADDTLTENTDVTSGAVFLTVTIDPIETADSISEAQLTLAGGLEDSDIINVNGTAITGLTTTSATTAALASGGTYDYDHTTGVLTIHFAGSTNAAAAEAILEAITFGIDASDNDPSTIARTVTLNTVTDNGGGTDTNADINETATISVGGVNDDPVITSDGGGDTANSNVVENTTAVTTVTATDPDLDTPTFNITGGADQALFSIDINGVLTFVTAPDYETATDSNIDGVYEVQVTVSDGVGGTDVQNISVTVTDVDEFDVGAVTDSNAAANTVTEDTIVGSTVWITA
ncbi:MAG: cadherin repeat domain-containing protein, partial [Desulfobacteraceae bacterium]|nr:cadherin repeat domain-containing protein [Desulfobacteraceae bacterium]